MAQLRIKCRSCGAQKFMMHPRKGAMAAAELAVMSGWTFTIDTGWLCDNEDCVSARAKDVTPIVKQLA